MYTLKKKKKLSEETNKHLVDCLEFVRSTIEQTAGAENLNRGIWLLHLSPNNPVITGKPGSFAIPFYFPYSFISLAYLDYKM